MVWEGYGEYRRGREPLESGAPLRNGLSPFFRVEEIGEIRIVGKCDSVIAQECERNFLRVPTDWHGKNLAPARFYGRAVFPCIGRNFLPLEFSIQDGKQSGVLSALLHRNRHAIEIARSEEHTSELQSPD